VTTCLLAAAVAQNNKNGLVIYERLTPMILKMVYTKLGF